MMSPITVFLFIFLTILMLLVVLAVASFIYFQLLLKKQKLEKKKIRRAIRNEVTKTLLFLNKFSANMPASSPVQKLLNEVNWQLHNNVSNILSTIDKEFSNVQ